ncbi:MAG TPA: septum formation initiator family protein [Candidatus Coprenecus merdipullorum]|nr:septum formation initiator family protein [Candidatus Coprenecus merdipullorum]
MEEEVQLNTELPAQDGIEPSDSQDNPAENRQPEPDEKRETRRKFVRVLTNKYFIVTLVFAVIVLFVDRNNLIRWAGDYLEVLRQERVIRQYGRDIEELDRKLDQLTSDRDSLEKFAREEYYFHREDEEVFIVD